MGGVPAHGDGMIFKAPSPQTFQDQEQDPAEPSGLGVTPLKRGKKRKENIPTWKKQELECRGFDGGKGRECALAELKSKLSLGPEPCPGLAPSPVRPDLLQAAPSPFWLCP